jgi:hypothetical protein
MRQFRCRGWAWCEDAGGVVAKTGIIDGRIEAWRRAGAVD